MTKDNSTGKNKDFYDLGKKMFDRLNLPGTPKPYFLNREWVGLTRREFDEAISDLEDLEDCWIAIEAKLKEKNT